MVSNVLQEPVQGNEGSCSSHTGTAKEGSDGTWVTAGFRTVGSQPEMPKADSSNGENSPRTVSST